MVLNTGAQGFSKLVVAGNGATINLGGWLNLGAIELPQNYFTDQGLYDPKSQVLLKGGSSTVGALQLDAGKLVLANGHNMVVNGSASTNPAVAAYSGGIQVDAGSILQFTGGASAASREKLSGVKLNVDGQAKMNGWMEISGLQLTGTGYAAMTGNVLFTGTTVLTPPTSFSASGAFLGVSLGSDLTTNSALLTGITGFDNQGMLKLQGGGQVGGAFTNGGTVRALSGVTSFSKLANLQSGSLVSGSWQLDGGGFDFGAGVTNNTTILALANGGTLALSTNGANGTVESYGYLTMSTPGFNNLGTVRASGGQVVVNGTGSVNNGVFEALGNTPNNNTYIWASGLLVEPPAPGQPYDYGSLNTGTFRASSDATIMVPWGIRVSNARIELADGGKFVDIGNTHLPDFLIENRGTVVISNRAGPAYYGRSSFSRTVAGDFINSGTLDLTRAAFDTNVVDSNFINSGGVTVREGSMAVNDVSNTGGITLSDNTLTVAGNFINSGNVLLNRSSLQVNGSLTLNGGSFAVQGSNVDLDNLIRPTATIAQLNPATGALHLDYAYATVNSGMLSVNGADGTATLLAGSNLRLRNDATLTLPELHSTAGPTPWLQTNAGNIELHDTARILGFDGENALVNLQRNEVGARLSLQNGAMLTVNQLENAGTLNIGAGSTLMAGNSFFKQTAGLLTVDGTLDGFFISLQGGVLNGNGVINGNLFVGGGPDTAVFQPGHSPGTMTVNEYFYLRENGVLELDLGRDASGNFAWDQVTASAFYLDPGATVRFVVDGTLTQTDLANISSLSFLHCANGSGCLYDNTGGDFTVDVVGYTGFTYSFDANNGDFHLTSLGTVTAVPEPHAYALLLAGLGVVGFVSRRRKRAQHGETC